MSREELSLMYEGPYICISKHSLTFYNSTSFVIDFQKNNCTYRIKLHCILNDLCLILGCFAPGKIVKPYSVFLVVDTLYITFCIQKPCILSFDMFGFTTYTQYIIHKRLNLP